VLLASFDPGFKKRTAKVKPDEVKLTPPPRSAATILGTFFADPPADPAQPYLWE
jgi:hypothetical protein